MRFIVADRSHEQLMRKQLLLLAVVFLSFVWLLFQIDTSLPSLLLPSARIIDLEFQGEYGLFSYLQCYIIITVQSMSFLTKTEYNSSSLPFYGMSDCFTYYIVIVNIKYILMNC